MGTITRKHQLFDALTQLRRSQRRHPDDVDLDLVVAFLERELGPTVPQRFAARCLGVTHSALARWATSGDLPLVLTASGRAEVPVAVLLALTERVAEARANGRSHVLEAQFLADREAAEALDPTRFLADGTADIAAHRGHDRSERRALVYHRALAQKLTRADVDEAQRALRRWRREGRIDERYAERWEELLELPIAGVRRAIGEDTQEARDLRQNSPFAGRLSEAERRKIVATID